MEVVLQKEMLGKELIKIHPDVTSEDRSEAMIQLKIKSARTIQRYLNGAGTNNDKAARLITFFKSRIANRNQVLA